MQNEIRNPFKGYELKAQEERGTKKINPVSEIVKTFYRINGIDKMPKAFYCGRYQYPKMAREAKMLYESCGENLDDCIWCLDKMKYLAEKGNFGWSIITCLKHNLHK